MLVRKKNKKFIVHRGPVVVATEKPVPNYARNLIEASLDPLFAVNLKGKIIDLNNATIKSTGVSREKLIGSDFTDYFTDHENARKAYQLAFVDGFIVDYPLTIHNRQLTDMLWNGSLYKDESGNIIGAAIIGRDVTAQKRCEKDLIEAKNNAEHAKQIAEEASKAKQQFLSNMSHEIRTPMNAIIGFSKLILKTDLTKKQKKYLNAIKLSGDALIVLINDILDLAKVDAGKMTFEKIPFKLASSMRDMLFIFENKIREKKLKLVKEYDTNIPVAIVGDPMRLQQIILNLLSNAVKFTTKGKITLGIRLIDEDTENVILEFSVSDTGIGIPKNKIEKIFENFQQASGKTSRLFGGTGLGLAIVKQMVQAQSGTLSLKSKVGHGSTFSFVLSFKKSEVKIETEAENVLELEDGIQNVKVLVAEDIALNQFLMKTVIQKFGFDVDIASNGRIAIEQFEKNKYDIILMDVHMPETNGFEATQHIRFNMNSTIPIIALTADVTSVDIEKCKSAGMNDYVSKPIDEKTLYKKIIKYIKKPIHQKIGANERAGRITQTRAEMH